MTKRFNLLLEHFLVFVTSTSFILALTTVTEPVFNNPELDRILINWFTYTVLAVSGLIISLIQQIFAREKIKSYLHIVAGFFYTLFMVIFCYFFRQMNVPYILIPFILILYAIEALLNEMFVYHERFIEECGDYQGKDLEAHLFHNNLSAIDFGGKAKIAEALLAILPFILVLVVFTVLKNGYRISIFALLFILLFFIGLFLCYFLLGIFRNDVFYGFLGFRDYIEDKRRLMRSISVILLAACVFGLLLSSNNALIKISFGYEEREYTPREQPEIQPVQEADNFDIAAELAKMYPDDGKFPAWIWDVIFGIMKWAAILGLSYGLIIFFFKPFFSTHFRQFWKEGRLITFFKHMWEQICEFFRYALSKKEAAQPYATVQSRKFGEGIRDYIKKAGRSKEKNAEIDRLTKHFMRLIDWGEAKEIHYHPNLAPAEYTALFKNETADLAGRLFEQALYDKNVLTKEEEKAFIDAVEAVICG